MVSTRTGRKSSIDSAGSKASSPRAPPSSKKPASAKKSASKKPPKAPKEPEPEEEEELEPLWFDDGQREAPAAPVHWLAGWRRASEGSNDNGSDGPVSRQLNSTQLNLGFASDDHPGVQGIVGTGQGKP